MTRENIMLDFLNIIDWLYKVNASFGIDHVCVKNKTYWLDTDADREELYNLWNGEKMEKTT